MLWWRGAAVWRSEGPCCGVAGPWRDAPGVLLCYYGASVLAGGAGLGRCAAAVPRCGAAVPLGEGGERRCWGRWLCWLWCRSEEHTSELQSLMRISYAVFCL